MIAVVAAIVFFDQFIVIKLREKMYPLNKDSIHEQAESDVAT
ncbi:MAG: hypothetical protein QM785_10045 [Pyrinomonadaceae bacterium]